MTTETMKEIEVYLPEAQRREVNVDLTNAQMNAKELVVRDQESMDKANNVLTWINSRQKGLESLRLAIVKPLKDHIKKIDNFFNGLSAEFDEPKEMLIKKVAAHREKLAVAARKEQERLEREAKEKEAKIKADLEEKAKKAKSEAEAERLRQQAAETVVLPKEPKKEAPVKTTYHDLGAVTYKKDGQYRIENVDLIPDQYYILDEKAIAKKVREIQKDLELGKVYKDIIPGVVITVTETPSIGRD